MRPLRLLLAAAVLAVPAACTPDAGKPPRIEARDAWARESVAGQTTGAAYVTLANRGGATDRLLGIDAAIAQSAMVHETRYDGGVARMRMLDGLELPAGREVAMKPGATHIMLTGLAAPLTSGQRVALTLRFEKAGAVKVEAEVRNP